MSSYTTAVRDLDVIRAEDLSSIAADARNQARHRIESMLNAIAERSAAQIIRKRSEGAAVERGDWCFPASTAERAELRDLWIEGQIYEDFLRRSNAALEETRQAYQLGTSRLRFLAKDSRRQLVGTLAGAGLKLAFVVLVTAAAAKVLMS